MGIRAELILRLPNSPGAAAAVCQQLADEHVAILAMMLDSGGHLHLLTDNHIRAQGVLVERHHRVSMRNVLVVSAPVAPPDLTAILRALRDAGINVDYLYGTTGSNGVGALVIGVDDAMHAATAV